MNISGIITFLAVVETGHLNKAAERLHVTQSTVTTRLDALEDMLGQVLLVRSRRGAQLTKAGFAFQRHAEAVVQAWEQARKAVGLAKGFSGLFSFACYFDLWDGAGSKWLDKVRQDRPDLALEAWPGALSEIKNWLQSGLVDAAMATEAIVGNGLGSQVIDQERLVQVSTTPRIMQAWDPAYIYVDLGPEFRRQHAITWPGDNTAHMTFGSSNWALKYLLSKGGSAYLPWGLIERLVNKKHLHLVPGSPEFSRPVILTWRISSPMNQSWTKNPQV